MAKKPTTPQGETKREKFIRLCDKRVETALNKIALVGNLANTSTYEYTMEDVNNVSFAIQGEVDVIISRLKNALEGKVSDKPSFSVVATPQGGGNGTD